MWRNYFKNIQQKYNMRVSIKEPLIIRLDGKSVTKNKKINLMNDNKNEFMYAMEETVKFFTKKYQCYAISGSDEVSFVFENPQTLLENISIGQSQYSHKIVSLFAQYFFQYFNNFDKSKLVFWDVRCFSIPREKMRSYIKYRSRSIENVMVTYYLKRNNKNKQEQTLAEKIEICQDMEDYKQLEKCKRGYLYYNGEQLDLNAFLNGEQKPVIKENIEAMFADFE